MTVEQKAKAYDKALEKAKIWQEHLYDVNDKDYADELNYIFPELSESEDEKIRKDILCYFEHYAHDIKGADLQKWIAWLEKQGEQNLIMARLPQLSEHKPKFKVGDWVVFTNGNVEHIVSVGIHGYTFGDGDYLLHDKCDKDAHLWSIQDARDGDVLFMDNGLANCIFIYKSSKNGIISKYASYNNFGFEGDHYLVLNDGYVIPATKEQRDTLFAKMKKAGYAFDFEKKELKKLGQPEVTKTSDQEEITEIPFGAKDSELQEETYFIPKGFHAEIDDDKVVIKKGEKPTAWSKKDEKMFEYALNMIEWYSGKNEDKSRFVSDWLKSLEDRVQPKQEWSAEDNSVLKDIKVAVASYWDEDTENIILDWLKSLKQRIGG